MEFSKTIVDDSFVEPGPLLFNPNELWPLKCTPLEMAPQVSHFFFFPFHLGTKVLLSVMWSEMPNEYISEAESSNLL